MGRSLWKSDPNSADRCSKATCLDIAVLLQRRKATSLNTIENPKRFNVTFCLRNINKAQVVAALVLFSDSTCTFFAPVDASD